MSRTSGKLQAHQGQEDALDGLAHEVVLHGGRADDGGRVDGVLALRDAGDVEDGVLVFERVVAGVIAEGAFRALFAQFHIAFEYDLRVGRHLQVAGFALDHLDRLAAQEPGDHHLVQIRRQRQDGRIHGGRIGADGHGHIHALHSARLKAPVVLGPLLVGLPVHAGGAVVIHLHAVHAAIALAGVGIAGEHERKSDEAATVLRPTLQDRVFGQGEAAAPDHLLAGSAPDGLREEGPHLRKLGQHFQLADETLRHAHLEEFGDAAGDFLDRGNFERDLHLAHARRRR